MPSPARASRRLHTPGIETVDDLAVRIEELRGMEREVGRTTPLDVVFMPQGLDMFSNAPVDPPAVLASIRALAAAGVTYSTLTVPGETRAQLIANIEIFGTEILPEVARL
jgi:hypothetical protein